MSTLRIRFTTAREVFEAFPAAREDIEAEPTDATPVVFMRDLLSSPTPEDAIAFCAYVLPRREAVWWGCQCVRRVMANRSPDEEAALAVAEAWVREPAEERRQQALDIGMRSNRSWPSTWVALAAAWSGGSMTSPAEGVSVPAAPHLTAKATRAAVLTALARVGAKDRATFLASCLEGGVRLTGAPSKDV